MTEPSKAPGTSPRSAPIRRWMLLGLTLLVLHGCSQGVPTGFAGHTFSGRVRLVGTLRDPAIDSTGDQVLDDVDGVRVHLLSGGFVVDSTLTVAGGYRFAGLRNGQYAAVSRLAGPVADTTETRIVTGNVVAQDTLVLRSTPDLTVYPNPFMSATRIRFALAADGNVELLAARPDGAQVRLLVQGLLPAGLHEVLWDGTDDTTGTVSPGPYWIVFQAGSDVRARLVLKTP